MDRFEPIAAIEEMTITAGGSHSWTPGNPGDPWLCGPLAAVQGWRNNGKGHFFFVVAANDGYLVVESAGTGPRIKGPTESAPLGDPRVGYVTPFKGLKEVFARYTAGVEYIKLRLK
jgi:hypothetical protein